MPFANWQERRLHICILAALSITIMLFTVVHLRHFLPSRHHTHTLDCSSLYAADLIECSEIMVEGEKNNAGKEWL